VRSFVALELPDPVRGALADVCANVRARSPEWAREKWVAPQNLHITLKFMGELDAVQLDALGEGLAEALAGVGDAPLFLNGLAAHPSTRRAAMLWAVPGRHAPEVARVAEIVDAQTALLGVSEEERRFRAHVTLVRARRPRRVSRGLLDDAWAEVFGAVPGSAADLFESSDAGKAPERFVSGSAITVLTSTLTRTGPVYETWVRIPLGRA
jgi:2'-5' RNA ligase